MRRKLFIYAGAILFSFVVFFVLNANNKAEAGSPCYPSDAGWSSGDPSLTLLELNVAFSIGGADPSVPSWVVGCFVRQTVGFYRAGSVNVIAITYLNPTEFTVENAGQEFYPTAKTIFYVMPDNPCCHVGISNLEMTHYNTTSANSTITFRSPQPISTGAIGYGTAQLRTHATTVKFNSIPSPGTYNQKYDFTLKLTQCSGKNCSTSTDSGYNYAVFNIKAPPKGWLQITKYGPNNDFKGHWPAPNQYFNMCMNYFTEISGSCTGENSQSALKNLTSGLTYTVNLKNFNGKADTNGWYINYVQRAQGGPIVPDVGFNQYRFPVYEGQYAWADIHYEKYACDNRASVTSPVKPKVGETFTTTFKKHNPNGITDWRIVDGVKMRVRIPPQFEFVSGPSVSEAPENSLEAAFGFDNKYIDLTGPINSGSDLSRALTFRVKNNAVAGQTYSFATSMVFPSKAPAANPFGSPFNCSDEPGIEVSQTIYYPWLQTKYGDVSAADFVSGQQYNKPGSREETSSEKEATNVIMATFADQQFCSVNLYALGRSPKGYREQCKNGHYTEDQRFGDIDTAINNAWNQNGAGSSPGCNPRYGTQKLTGSTKVGTNLSSCANGTIYQVNSGASLSSLLAGQPSQGRATIWVKGNLTVDRTVIYNYAASYAKPEDIPNLAIYVEGEVIIQSSINQLDAAIISTGKIKTCGSDYSTTASAPTCGSQLVVHGYLFANGGYQFGRNYYVEASNTNPAEKIVLTGQSIAFPPPGLDKASLGNNDLKITEEDNPRVK